MYSKLILSLMAVLVLGACSANIGEQPPPPTAQTFGGAQCLSDSLPVITDFIQGKATDAKVAEAWDCFSIAIEQFRKRIIGRSQDGYTPGELATFLQDNFFKFKNGQTISPQLQDEVMKIKQLLIGGSRESLTRKELDDAIVLFKNLKAISLKLNPYMKIYSLNWAPSAASDNQADTALFEQANVTLQDIAKDLAALVQKNNQGYELSDFPNFIKELNGLYDKPWSLVTQVSRFMPVVKKIKKAIAGGDEDVVIPAEWDSFLLLGSRGYVQYMRYYYFIESAAHAGTGIRLGYLSRVAEDTLSIFQDLVERKASGVVSREDITEILKSLAAAWPDFKISDNLVFEAMKVKQLLIGGSTEAFTANDFGSARFKIAKIKTIVERFLPYYSIYGLDWDRTGLSSDEVDTQLSEAQTSLEKASQDLAGLFEVPYDINNFYSLLHEVVVLYAADPDDNALDKAVKKYLPLVIDVKNMTFAENDPFVKKTQWAPTLLMAAKSYSLFMYEQYFYKGNTFKSTTGMRVAQVLANRGLDLVKDLLAINPNKKFRQGDVNKLAQRVVALDILPGDFSPDVVTILVDVVLNRVLVSPEGRLDGYVPGALTLGAVEILRFEFQSWLGLERFFDSIYPQGNEAYNGPDIRSLVAQKKNAQSAGTPLRTGLSELAMMLNSPVPLTIDASSHLIISNQITKSYRKRSLSQLNFNRLIARVLIRSYGQNLDRINNYEGIRVEEAQKAFADLKPVGVALGLLNPNNTTFATSRFREANIFTVRADGNGLSSFLETSDLIGMIWSGVNVNSEIKKDLIDECLDGRSDVKDSTTVGVDCAFRVYGRHISAYTKSMPSFINYLGSATPEQWSSYFGNVLKAAGYVPNDSNRAEMGDVALVPHVIQYIEMVFAKYDDDQDGLISAKEALAAFPAFQTILKDLAKGQVPDDELDDLFTYILKFGKPPETVSEKLKYGLNWRNKPEKWDIQADRTQLAKILGYIADQVAKNATAQAPKKIASKPRSEFPRGR